MTNRTERIRSTLSQVFVPSFLEVMDDSAKHAGHAGARPEGETHFRIKIISEEFRGMDRVSIQRAVNKALEAEFDNGLHALQIKAKAPKD